MRRLLIPIGLLVLVLAGIFTMQTRPMEESELMSMESLAEADSRLLAEYQVKGSSTFAFDGVDLGFSETTALKCPYCWSHEFYFTSQYAGYGNEADRVELIEAPTPHTIVVVMDNKDVKSVIVDNTWDEIKRDFI